jgi:hypothetical protein
MAVSGRDDEPATSPDRAMPLLPGTVVSAHFSACATELAGRTGPQVSDIADLMTVVEDLIAGQRQIGLALARLADQLADRGRRGALAQVGSPDLSALAEVLGAAASATGHAAGALAESRPVLDIVLASAGPDAPL